MLEFFPRFFNLAAFRIYLGTVRKPRSFSYQEQFSDWPDPFSDIVAHWLLHFVRLSSAVSAHDGIAI